MSNREKLFVVLDPGDDEHSALQRALMTASQRQVKPRLHIFIAVDGEAVDTGSENDRLFRGLDWLDLTVRQPLLQAAIEFTVELCWSSEWQWAIQHAANRFGADTIYLPVHTHACRRRGHFSESHWDLLKTAACPVLLVMPGSVSPRRVVLAAVNLQVQREHQQALNQRIIERGRLVAKRNGAEFHIVNAYLDSMHCPDKRRLTRETQVPVDHIHVRQGYTDDVVAAVARDIKADIVIIGTLGQAGKKRSRRGHTAQRVIAGLEADVMVFNHTMLR